MDKKYKRIRMKGFCCNWCDGPAKLYKKQNRRRSRSVAKRDSEAEIEQEILEMEAEEAEIDYKPKPLPIKHSFVVFLADWKAKMSK